MNKVAVIGIAGNSVFMNVENFHRGGETVEASGIRFEPGGKGFNQAIAAAKAGSEVSFLAAVGNDCPDSVLSALKESGVKPYIVRKNGNTAFAAIITDQNGNNRVTVHQGVQLSVSDVDAFEKQIEEADILLINNEVSQEINTRAAEIATRCGKTVILNPAPARELPSDFIGQIAWFTPNEHETAGIEERENMIQTLGKNGCRIKCLNKTVPPIDVEVIDTTGAGDTFNGYLASMLAKNCDIETATKYAIVSSGISVTRHGACYSIPMLDEVEAFIQNNI